MRVLDQVLTTATIETRFHNENVISTLALFLSLFPSHPFVFFPPDFKKAPGWDKLMYLRCGNQILNILPSPSSLFFSCFSPKTPSFPHPILPAVLCNRVYWCTGTQCDRSTERNKKDLVCAFFFIFYFFTEHILCQIPFFSFHFTVPWALQLIASSKPLTPPLPPPVPYTPSHPNEPWPTTAAWPDVEEKEMEAEEELQDGERPPPAGNEDWSRVKGERRRSNMAGTLMCESEHKLSPIGHYLALPLETTYSDHTGSPCSLSSNVRKFIISAASHLFPHFGSPPKPKLRTGHSSFPSFNCNKRLIERIMATIKWPEQVHLSGGQRSHPVSKFLHGQSWFMKQLGTLRPESMLTQYSWGLSD